MKSHRWLLPTALLGLGFLLLFTHSAFTSTDLAIQYMQISHSRFVLGIRASEFFEILQECLPIWGWLCLGLGVGYGITIWFWPVSSSAAWVFVAFALVYAISSGSFLLEQSGAPHFVYLADALAHGQVFIDSVPPNAAEGDWTLYQGQWTVSFPPLPAFLMLPWVAWIGKEFNDVLFTLLFGALNVAIFYTWIPHIGAHTWPVLKFDRKTHLGLTFLFGLGTVHWWVASMGQVWFSAQIIALTFLLLALLEGFDRGRPLLIGLWLSLAGLGRPTMLLALPFLIWMLVKVRRTPLKRLSWGLIPLAVTGAGMAWFNFLRFGDPLELGYRYMQIEKLLEGPLLEHGQFSLAFLGQNLKAALLMLPDLSLNWPFVRIDAWGLSLLISTPALLLIGWAPWREKISQASALSALLVAAPSLLYYNTGYAQAGYRFSLDFLPFLLILVAQGTRGQLSKGSILLIAASILMGFFCLVNIHGLYLGWL